MKKGPDGHLLKGASGHLCKTCCDGTGGEEFLQGVDCKNSDAPLPIYAPTSLSPGTSTYRFGGYCVKFTGGTVTEVPAGSTLVTVLPEALETCDDCEPEECPEDNDACGTTFLATALFPELCSGEPTFDRSVEVEPQGDGTWAWQPTEPTNLIVYCDGGYWYAVYNDSVLCASSAFTWRTPRFGDCPAPTDPDAITVPWEFVGESHTCCDPDFPTFTLTLP